MTEESVITLLKILTSLHPKTIGAVKTSSSLIGGAGTLYSVYLALDSRDYLIQAITLLIISLAVLIIGTYIYAYRVKRADEAIMEKLLNMAVSQEQLHHADRVDANKVALKKIKPIHRLELERYISAIIAFSKPLSDLSSGSRRFSQDDVGLLRFWISEDTILASWLENFHRYPESILCDMLFLLMEKGDLSRGQWCQLCTVLIEFMGGVPESPQIRAEMCVFEDE